MHNLYKNIIEQAGDFFCCFNFTIFRYIFRYFFSKTKLDSYENAAVNVPENYRPKQRKER